jgi:hypothetical protein
MPQTESFYTVEPPLPGNGDRFLYKALQVRKNLPIYGRGLFAVEEIPAGEKIFSFNGTFISREQASELALQVGDELFLETDPESDYENCINHACYTPTHKANCRLGFGVFREMNKTLEGQRSEPTDVTCIAISLINAGDQLFFDYATTEKNMDDADEGQVCSFDCNCGSNCRGHISGFENLTEEQAALLYPLMSPYIQSLAIQKFNRQF